MKKQYYYIGERINPQLKQPYYLAYGKLSKNDALKKEDCAYGFIIMQSYQSEEEFESAKTKLVKDGFRVSNVPNY